MQYHYYLYGMRVTADLDFVQLDPVRLPEDDRDFGREKVRIRAMDEEEEAQFRKEHGDCVCGSFLGTEKGWLCNRTLAMSVERGQVIRYHIRKGGDPGAVRTYLLGFGIAMLSIQQGKLPIHCSALATPEGGAILIAGESGAGKSTLLNAITGSDIPANNRLFDTLDTTTRLLTVSDTLDVVISDTVGFIRKLPHQLVEAFKATLEELEYADLLLHVIDASNPEWQEQARIVDDLIRELGAENIPCIRVYNKSDLAFAFQRDKEGDAVSVSAKTGEGLDRLLSAIDKKLDKGTKRVTLHLPYDKAGALDSLYREAKVESVEYCETVDVVAVCTPRIIGQLKDYIEGWTEPKEEWE